ncbi:MAG: RluA family pseudouridine synthase [Actinomycetes bacterium]
MSDLRRLQVPDGLAGERMDSGLARLTGLSRTKAAELIIEGRVRVDGSEVVRSDRLVPETWLEIEMPDARPTHPEPDVPVDGLTVVYQDADVVVIDKPVGVAAHSSPGWTGPTVTSGLRALGIQASTRGASEREGIVHRLDVGTSGLMVVAKSELAYVELKRQFRDRTVSKTYHALVQGHPDPSRGTINAPIGRHPSHDYKFAVVAGGKKSVTHYETIEAFSYASLLGIGLETGRTHQIRVHMAALHHPCCGDLTYGADPNLAQKLGLTRQWLHAVLLAFDHPATGQRVTFESKYPADLAAALNVLADY